MAEAVVEPWLRGTLTETPAVARGVLHALELAREDVTTWCGLLNDAELNQRPLELPPVAFHLRHIARSLDRLLTYAEGRQLSSEQTLALKTEMDTGATHDAVLGEFNQAIERSMERIRQLAHIDFNQARAVGRRQLPTSVGGLLVHVADHTQRHVGQAITTAKVLLVQRSV